MVYGRGMSDLLQVERRPDGVVFVTLNRPQARNALSLQLNNEISALMYDLNQEPSPLPIVITGAGETFCAGADLKERKGVPADEASTYVDAISGAIKMVAAVRRPTIAAMNGSAYGGGLELALACDLRLLADNAEVGLTEVRLGIMPGAGGTQRLPRLVGEAHAKELIMLGRRISAKRAHEIGLVHQLAPASGFRAAVDALLDEMSLCAPLSVAFAKNAIERGMEMPLEQALEMEREVYDQTLYTEDRNEGLAAFAEKRPPRFQGR
jgi:methylglutaconyl-CoA hydratase